MTWLQIHQFNTIQYNTMCILHVHAHVCTIHYSFIKLHVQQHAHVHNVHVHCTVTCDSVPLEWPQVNSDMYSDPAAFC